MKKSFKNALALACGLVLSVSAVACGGRGGEGGGGGPVIEKLDSSRTQIYVLNYNGGIGDTWLQALKKRFETQYSDFEGDDGKVGVQVYIDNTKTNCSSGEIVEALKTSRDHVWFTEVVPYNTVVSSKGLYDITSAVTSSLSAYGENKTIESKLTADQQAYLKINGSYYGLPTYSTYPALTYNKDIFRDYKLYFADDYVAAEYDGTEKDIAEAFIATKNSPKSVGADGISGTSDDGLPVTFFDFELLCKRMVQRSVTPFIWSGLYREYTQNIPLQMRVCYDGYDTEYLRYTFDGEASGLIDVAADGTVTPYNGNGKATITKENAYLLNKSAGTYYGIDFFKKVIANKWYYFESEDSHIDAQADFVMSNLENKPIAMLVDGTWWENEAEEGFKLAVAKAGDDYSRENSHFGVMRCPSQYEDGKQTFIDMNYAMVFANAYVMNKSSDKTKNLVLEFIKFAHTDASLVEFTQTVGLPKGLTYSLTEEQMSGMSEYSKEVWNLKYVSDIVYPYSNTKVYKENEGLMKPKETSLWYNTQVGDELHGSPLAAFYTATRKPSAIEYFNGMQTYWSQFWSRTIL